MTTTELIELLKSVERGVSGRSREVSFQIKGTRKSFISDPVIEIDSTGDGIAGAELCLRLTASNK